MKRLSILPLAISLMATLHIHGQVLSPSPGFRGLKDLEGNKTLNTPDGAMYILAMGETVESRSSDWNNAIVLAAGVVTAPSSNSITLKFQDNTVRTWQIAQRIPVCDESGLALSMSDITNGMIATVRWQITNNAALMSAKQGQPLNIRRGPMRQKFGQNGRGGFLPTLADHSCGSVSTNTATPRSK